jgi:prepilin-type processing-associated H-X9-DG protein
VLPKKQWPKIRFKEKRAVTAEEHKAIIATEKNPERRAFYELCWHLGGAQSDMANLVAEDIDWQTRTVSFYRKKTGSASIIRFGAELETILQNLPKSGPLFPKLKPMREAHRATEFRRACRRLKLSGITLHSYRYSWAERARSCGYSMNACIGQGTLDIYPKYRSFSRLSDFTRPAYIYVLMDEHADTISTPGIPTNPDPVGSSWEYLPASYHNGGSALSFADGHCETHQWRLSKTRKPVTYSGPSDITFLPFQNPDYTWVAERRSVPK